jgi:hypothetical protein
MVSKEMRMFGQKISILLVAFGTAVRICVRRLTGASVFVQTSSGGAIYDCLWLTMVSKEKRTFGQKISILLVAFGTAVRICVRRLTGAFVFVQTSSGGAIPRLFSHES